MATYENFYGGATYGLDAPMIPDDQYGGFVGYHLPAGQLGFPSDPMTANQAEAVSKKLSTGATVVEVSGIDIMGGGGGAGPNRLLEAIPKQQFAEINRLKKLAGAELTFHGPLVEATGFTGQQGWTELDRQRSELEVVRALEKGHQMDPDGNIVTTFHSSNGLFEPETKVINELTNKEETVSIFAVDERTGNFTRVVPPKETYLGTKKVKFQTIENQLQAKNEEDWYKQLQAISFHGYQGRDIVKNVSNRIAQLNKNIDPEKLGGELAQLYKIYLDGKQDKIIKAYGEVGAEPILEALQEITHGDLYIREAYTGFREKFDEAFFATKKYGTKKDLEKLKSYQARVSPIIDQLEKDPTKIAKFGDEIINGLNVLRSIAPPKVFVPVRGWAIDKASDTFSKAAFKSYKKFGDSTPIISIENPPAGSGLNRASELRDLVKASRKKFTQKAVDELGMSKSEAKKQAEKLIGVTWDVGHINMIRGKGYGEKELLKETKIIAPYVKHVHLSDNFGLEHTELPMGMGNVPTKKMLKLIEGYNKKAKKIVETGDWFSQRSLQQKTTPFLQSLSAFSSPIYSMEMAPQWNAAANAYGAYFSGYGQLNPQIHHQYFGAGFSNLPVELGGQMAGQNRLSGAPME